MAFTPEQLQKLRATDPAIVKQALERMTPAQRSEVMAAIRAEAPASTQAPQPAPDGWEQTPYGFRARAWKTPEGYPTSQREDGAIYYGPEQGNTGKAGWFNAEGRRVSDAVGTTATGVLSGVVRGGGPYAAGAAGGALVGAPIGGVGAVPGALAGTAAVGLTKLIGDPAIDLLNRAVQGDEYGVKPAPYMRPTEILERAVDWMGIPMASTPTERLVQTGTEAAAGTAGTIGLGRTLAGQGGTVGRVGEVLAANPQQQLGGALGGGLAAQGAAEAGLGPTGQLVAGLGGGLVGGVAATPRAVAPSAARAAVVEAEKAGVPVLTSDVMPPSTFAGKFMQSAGEKIPFVGTGGQRRVQQASRVQAVKEVLADYGAGAVADVADVAAATDKVVADLLAKRGGDVQKYVKLKTSVFEKLADAGAMPTPKATAAIDEQIQRLNMMGTKESQQVIDRLKDWRQAIQNKPISVVEDIRKQVGEGFKGADQGAIRSMGEKALDAVYGPLREDMGDFIKVASGPQDYTKWKVANARLAESAKETTTTALKRVLQAGEAEPEAVQRLLFSQKPSDVKLVIKSLTPQGQANARMAILAKVASDAGGVENLSPEKFINAARRLASPIGVAFAGQDEQKLNGLLRALKLTQQASKSALVPPTGVQAVPFLAADVLSTTLGGPQGATLAAGGLGLAARAYESKPMRDLLLRFPKVTPGSVEEAALMKRFINLTTVRPAQQSEKENGK